MSQIYGYAWLEISGNYLGQILIIEEQKIRSVGPYVAVVCNETFGVYLDFVFVSDYWDYFANQDIQIN